MLRRGGIGVRVTGLDVPFGDLTRSERSRQEVGDYYTVDLRRNFILEKDVDLEEKARELGALAAFERVAGEED